MNKLIPPLPPSMGKMHSDSLAIRESLSLENDNLEKQASVREHRRREKFKDHMGCSSLIIFWFMVSILLGMIFCWGWNILTPASWHFLNESQVDKIQTILFTASVVELLPSFVKKYL